MAKPLDDWKEICIIRNSATEVSLRLPWGAALFKYYDFMVMIAAIAIQCLFQREIFIDFHRDSNQTADKPKVSITQLPPQYNQNV